MIRIITLLFCLATVADAAPAITNRVAGLKIATNRVQMIQGAPVAKSLLKTQPKAAVRVKDASGRTRDLPIMFNNNKIKRKGK